MAHKGPISCLLDDVFIHSFSFITFLAYSIRTIFLKSVFASPFKNCVLYCDMNEIHQITFEAPDSSDDSWSDWSDCSGK